MSKSYIELLLYSKKIIARGDGWKSLHAYLAKNCNNLMWRERIISDVKIYEEYINKKRRPLKQFQLHNDKTLLIVLLIIVTLIISLIWTLKGFEGSTVKIISSLSILTGAYLLLKKKK